MEVLENIHPGEILLTEFLTPLNISVSQLADGIKVSVAEISALLAGESPIKVDTALRLSLFFGNSAKFWLGLQEDYDLEELMKCKKIEFKKISRLEYCAV